MDKMIYTAMSGAKQAQDQQAVISHNLANVETSGFRGQMMNMRAVPVPTDGTLGTRASVAATTPGADFSSGPLQSTGRDLDIALSEGGWLAVQGPDGQEAYTRRGDLQIDGNGLLLSGGQPVLGQAGPIVVPMGSQLSIGSDGTISGIAEGQEANALVQMEQLKVVDATEAGLQRGEDGLFRPEAGGILARSDDVTVTTGVLEGSNVSAVESMVAMIDNARRYDMQMKSIESADQNAQQGNGLLSMR